MNRRISFAALLCAAAAGHAGAHEYKLQYTPNAGARGLAVAGYAFDSNNNVVGNCSYYTVHSGSGRGGGYKTITTHFDQTCTWDAYGNLLSVVAGAPVAPPPLYTSGTLTVYATNAYGDATGVDTTPGIGGFVNTPGSHYTWQTSTAYQVIPQAIDNFTAMLISDGDVPLVISGVQGTALNGRISVNAKQCLGTIAIGQSCGVAVSYDPRRLVSPTGLAYDTVTLSVTSDSGQAYDFIQSFTIQLTPANTTDGDD